MAKVIRGIQAVQDGQRRYEEATGYKGDQDKQSVVWETWGKSQYVSFR